MTDDTLDDDLIGPLERTDGPDTTESLIAQAIDIVNAARPLPLSSSVRVEREELIDLLSAASERLPREVREARWLLKERDEFMEARQREADNLMEEVRVQAERMVQRTEIVRQANHVAQRILDDAREEARRLRHEAEDYCDQKLAGFEIVLDRTIKTVRSGREKLQVTPLPPGVVAGAEAPPSADAAAVGAKPGEDGFFDQDEV